MMVETAKLEQSDCNHDMVREVELTLTIGNGDKRRTVELNTYLCYEELKELVCFAIFLKSVEGGEDGRQTL